MVITTCKHCGAKLKVDDARLGNSAREFKCPICRNTFSVDLPKTSPVITRPIAPNSATAPARPAKPSAPSVPSTGAFPIAGHSSPAAVAAVAAEVETEARPVAARTHYLQKIKLFSALSYEECLMVEGRPKP